MREMILGADRLEMWIHQNEGIVDDVIEGSLLDNLLVYCKRGVAIIKERYVNEWSSNYHIYFERGEGNEIFRIWDEIQAAYDENTSWRSVLV